MSQAPPPAQRLTPAARRALIEEGAERLFAERGYAATTVEDIVAAAGVTKPVLYLHYASKKALHLALLQRHRDALADRALAEYVSREGSLEDRLPAMFDAWFSYVEEHPYAWRMLFADTTGDREVQDLHRELQRQQRAADMAIIAQSAAWIPQEQREPLAEVVRASLTGLALWWLDHPDVPRRTLVETMLRMVRGIVAGPA